MNPTSSAIEDLLYNNENSIEEIIRGLNQQFIEVVNSRKDHMVNELVEVLGNCDKKLNWKLECYILSFLLEYLEEPRYLDGLMSHLESNSEIDFNEYNFLYWQLTKKLFVTPKLNTPDNQMRLRKIYTRLFDFFNEQLQQVDNWIPLEQRDRGLVIVMIGQLLSPLHAPTLIAFEQCSALIKKFNKRVLLINTADMPRTVCLPYYSPQLWNYTQKYSEVNSLTYEGVRIPFYQFTEEMPSGNEMDSVIQTVLQLKPEYILSIGGSNITADLCSNFVPVVTSPCSVEIPISEGTFLLLPRKATDEDRAVINNLSQPEDRVIESEVSYKPRKTGNKLIRSDWGIDNSHVVIVIVGNRLNEEMTDDFLSSLNTILSRNLDVRIAIVGEFSKYETLSENYRSFKQQSVLMGYQKDLSAVYSMSDIYLNPPRKGGGTSAAEALYMGIPAFSYPFGDVSYVVTKKYHIQNLEQLEAYLVKWNKEDFRESQRKLALSRAEEIFDSSRVLSNIVDEMMKLSAFQ